MKLDDPKILIQIPKLDLDDTSKHFLVKTMNTHSIDS